MNRINKFLQNNIEKIINYFIIIQPILDVIAAISLNVLHINLTLSSIIRFAFVLLCIYYIMILDKTKNKKQNILKVLLIGIYILCFSITTIITKDTTVLSFELKNTINTFFLPITLLALIDISKQYKIKFKIKTIAYTYTLYIILIAIPNITQTGFNSYDYSKVGCVGWFQSANAIGNILSILIPIITIYLLKIKEKKILKILIILLSLYSIASMGTKVPIISLLICTITTLLYYIIKWIKQKKYKLLLLSTTITTMITAIALIIIPKTSFYKNIQIHKEYLGFNSYTEILTDYKLIDHFIFSQRLTFLKNTSENYQKANIKEKLFGIGYIENYGTDNVNTKTIEIDYFEILFRNGIIGFILYFSIIIPIIIKSFKIKNIEFKLCIILILLLALFSGHILITPAVSIFVALILTIISQGGFYEKIN